jgi:predicted transcriptional regulator
MPARPSAASFSAFLEDSRRQAQSSTPSTNNPFKLLKAIDAAEGGTISVVTLMAVAGLQFNEFAENMKSLQEAGLVAVAGEPGAESVSLTGKGSAVLGIVA